MGLDQYIERKGAKREEIFYWRKFGELQNLMEQIWREQTPFQDDAEFNCTDLVLTPEICDRVIQAIKSRNLPDHNGFFFGTSNMEDADYLNEAIERFEAVKQELEDNPAVELVYHAWY